MQLEVGKYYKTRDGRKVGPMIDLDNGCNDPWKAYLPGEEVTYWRDSGSHWGDIRPSDLIAEWTDEPAPGTLSSETIDHIAIDSLRHHYATEMEPLQKEAFRIVLRYYGVTM